MLEPGIYIATKWAYWVAETKNNEPAIFLVTRVDENGHVHYQYLNADKGTRNRSAEVFMDCGPVAASQLLQELI